MESLSISIIVSIITMSSSTEAGGLPPNFISLLLLLLDGSLCANLFARKRFYILSFLPFARAYGRRLCMANHGRAASFIRPKLKIAIRVRLFRFLLPHKTFDPLISRRLDYEGRRLNLCASQFQFAVLGRAWKDWLLSEIFYSMQAIITCLAP